MGCNLGRALSACPTARTPRACPGQNGVLSKLTCGSPDPPSPEFEDEPHEARERVILQPLRADTVLGTSGGPR